MKTVGKSIFVSLLLTVGLMALLNWESITASRENVDAIGVAAGDIPLEDPTSPEPLEHCYPFGSTGEMDVKTLVDFEARTAKDWVVVEDTPEGEVCLVETDKAKQERLATQEPE